MKPRFKHVYLHRSKESEGVKFKKGICVALRLKLWFESDWYFCKITESEWFWRRLFRKKLLNDHFLKSFQKQPYTQMFFKIPVLRIFAIFTGKHLCWNLFLIKFQGVFLWILRKFYKQIFLVEYLQCLLLPVW